MPARLSPSIYFLHWLQDDRFYICVVPTWKLQPKKMNCQKRDDPLPGFSGLPCRNALSRMEQRTGGWVAQIWWEGVRARISYSTMCCWPSPLIKRRHFLDFRNGNMNFNPQRWSTWWPTKLNLPCSLAFLLEFYFAPVLCTLSAPLRIVENRRICVRRVEITAIWCIPANLPVLCPIPQRLHSRHRSSSGAKFNWDVWDMLVWSTQLHSLEIVTFKFSGACPRQSLSKKNSCSSPKSVGKMAEKLATLWQKKGGDDFCHEKMHMWNYHPLQKWMCWINRWKVLVLWVMQGFVLSVTQPVQAGVATVHRENCKSNFWNNILPIKITPQSDPYRPPDFAKLEKKITLKKMTETPSFTHENKIAMLGLL